MNNAPNYWQMTQWLNKHRRHLQSYQNQYSESGIYSAPGHGINAGLQLLVVALVLESGIDSAPGNGINSGLQRQLNHYSLFIMLNSLTIKNFTIFSEAQLEFSPGLNVVIRISLYL